MAIARTSCRCMSTISRDRLFSRNRVFFQVSCHEPGRCQARLARSSSVQTTCRTSSPMRTANISTIATSRDDGQMNKSHRPSLRTRLLPTITRSSRPLFTSVSSSQAVVAAVQSAEHSEDVSVEPALSKSQHRLRRRGLIQYYKLRRCGAFKDHVEIPTSEEEGSFTFHASLTISADLVPPGTRRSFRVEGRAQSTVETKHIAKLLLRSRLVEAHIWEILLHRCLQAPQAPQALENQENKLRLLQPWVHECDGTLDFEERGSPETGYKCYSTAQFQALNWSIEGEGEASSKELARQDAMLELITQLQSRGLWPGRNSSELEPSPYIIGPEEEGLLDIFNQMRDGKKLFQLRVEESGSFPTFTCHVALSMPGCDHAVEATMSAPRKKEASKLARLQLISNLEEAGLWRPLLEATLFPPRATISINDDLFRTLRLTRKMLLLAGKHLQMNIYPHRTSSKRRLSIAAPAGCIPGYSEERSRSLTRNLADLRHSGEPQASSVRKVKAELPVSGFKESILESVRSATYCLIVAETGSGKSTQVPQMILDNAIDQGMGGQCRILCVQPRRLAAQLLARRVAYERCEDLGDSVGYSVRFNSEHAARSGSITYCTAGIMLNYLKHEFRGVGSFTHILLDEVHVRDIEVDFVMLLLKRYVEHCREAGIPPPKVVVMSATVDVDLFSSYFCNEGPNGSQLPAPHVSIPGRQYRVQRQFLSEVLEASEASLTSETLSKLLSEGSTKLFLKKQQQLFSGKIATETEDQDDINNLSSQDLAEDACLETPTRLHDLVDSTIPYGLVAALVFHLLKTTQDGAILVFLPGLQQLFSTKATLFEFDHLLGFDLERPDHFKILTLHSTLEEEQAELSKEIPAGCRRIILATDIAEASLTIPDVRYVIDSGRVNKKVYNDKLRANRLDSVWASQSSAMQRAGRAGRVHDGHYYFLGTKHLFESLPVNTAPEMLRGDLQSTCLVAKRVVPELSVSETLQQAIEPPGKDKVLAAVDSLKSLKAFDENEDITSLGRLLVLLPLIPAFGKLVILGIIFRCLDPLLVLAVMGNEQRIFRRGLSHVDNKAINQDRAKFAGDSASDHLSAFNAFQAVRNEWQRRGAQGAYELAVSNNIMFKRYIEIYTLSRHVLRVLVQARFIRPKSDVVSLKGTFGDHELNTNSHSIPLIKALLLYCLSPQIAARREFKENSIPMYCTESDNIVFFPKQTLALNVKSLPPALALYSSKFQVASDMNLQDVTLISPLTAGLFGGKLARKGDKLIFNSWLKLGLDNEDASLSKLQAAQSILNFSSVFDKALAARWDSLDLERQIWFKKEWSPTLCASRENLDDILQETVMGVLNRDLYRFQDLYVPTSWEDPVAKEWPVETIQAVQ